MVDDLNSDLKGAVAVVTGAAQGLGLAIAEELGGRGARVIVVDLQLDKAEAECERLRSQGLEARAALLDVSESAAVDAFFASLDGVDRVTFDFCAMGMRAIDGQGVEGPALKPTDASPCRAWSWPGTWLPGAAPRHGVGSAAADLDGLLRGHGNLRPAGLGEA